MEKQKTFSPFVKHLVVAVIVAGTLDALCAMIVLSAKPEPLFRYIASGLFGMGAFSGGTEMIVAGIFLHYVIALAWTYLFFWIFPKLKMEKINSLLIAVVYGALIWVVMNVVILPLTKVPSGKFDWPQALKGIMILILAVAYPVTLITKRWLGLKKL